MGDRHFIQLKCAGCQELNPSAEDYNEDPMENGLYYAPSSGFMDFTCRLCKRINWIEYGFTARLVTEEELKSLYKREGFE